MWLQISAVAFYVVVILTVQVGLGKHWEQFDMANIGYFLRVCQRSSQLASLVSIKVR
jgi:hypothetical protein